MNTDKKKRYEWCAICYKGKVAVFCNPNPDLKGYSFTEEHRVLPDADKNQYQDLYEHISKTHNDWLKFKNKMNLKKEFTKRAKAAGWEYSDPCKPWTEEDHKKYDDPTYLDDKSLLDKEYYVYQVEATTGSGEKQFQLVHGYNETHAKERFLELEENKIYKYTNIKVKKL